MYTGLFKTLQLTVKNLSPYVGNELYGFKGSSTQPWGYVELLVAFGEKEAKKTIKIPFLVIDYLSLQLHYRENRARPTGRCMFNRSSEVEIPCKRWHHRLSQRRH